MAFPSSTQSLDAVWMGSQSTAARIRTQAQETRNTSAAGNISTKVILDFATGLADAIQDLDTAAATPGIAQYARDQLANPALDIAAEFTAMRAQMVATRDWIGTNFPADVNSYLLFIQFTAERRFTYRQFTSAQTAGLRTQLDALIATIA